MSDDTNLDDIVISADCLCDMIETTFGSLSFLQVQPVLSQAQILLSDLRVAESIMRAERAELGKFREALIWCSGSPDFNVGGQARLGWLRLCARLLQPNRDDSAEIAELEAALPRDPTNGGEDHLDRAIAALSVPEVAEVEIPEGFVKWEGGESPFFIGTHLEVFTRKNGVWPVVIKPEAPLLWEHEGHDLDIIAYRVLPIEPAEYEDPTAVAIAAYIEAEQADYPDLTDEQDAAIESATAEYQSTDGAEIVSGEPWENIHGAAPHTLSIAASSQHAEESARAQDLAPLFPPEREQPATPEELMESGAINGEAYGLWRKLAKVEA